jgi:hypothetical protein
LDWNRLRYRPGQHEGHYESYYLRANDPASPRALWIRYTLFSPRGRPEDAIGEIWAIGFDGAAGRHVAVKTETPFAQCSFDPQRLAVKIDGATLDGESLRGAAQSGGHRIAWDLRYGGGQEPLLFMEAARYDAAFPAAKSVVTRPLARFSGTLDVDGVQWTLADWPGSQNHNWGRRHTDRYAFGQVCGFDDSPETFLEIASARLRIRGFTTPTLTPIVLRHDGRQHSLTSIPQALLARARRGDFDWQFATSSDGVRIEGRIVAAPQDFVGLRYYNPPGGVKHCLNTKIARCELSLTPRGGATRRLTSRHGALFEILDDDGDGRVGVAA